MSKEKLKNNWERFSLVATIGFVAFAGSGGFKFLKPSEKLKISPQAEHILASNMKPTAVKIGNKTLEAIAGNHRDVVIMDDTYHNNGSIIEVTMGLDDLKLKLDVRMENKKGVLEADTTYGVAYTQEVISLNDVSTGGIAEDVDSNNDSGAFWFGSLDSTTTTGVGDRHVTTSNADSVSASVLRKEVAEITDQTNHHARFILSLLEANTASS